MISREKEQPVPVQRPEAGAGRGQGARPGVSRGQEGEEGREGGEVTAAMGRSSRFGLYSPSENRQGAESRDSVSFPAL